MAMKGVHCQISAKIIPNRAVDLFPKTEFSITIPIFDNRKSKTPNCGLNMNLKTSPITIGAIIEGNSISEVTIFWFLNSRNMRRAIPKPMANSTTTPTTR
jgi:hypothetical protein